MNYFLLFRQPICCGKQKNKTALAKVQSIAKKVVETLVVLEKNAAVPKLICLVLLNCVRIPLFPLPMAYTQGLFCFN